MKIIARREIKQTNEYAENMIGINCFETKTHEYLLDNGNVVTTIEAYQLALDGLIDEIQCDKNIKTYNDLKYLPTF